MTNTALTAPPAASATTHNLDFMGFPVTAFVRDGKAWLLAADVAEALDAANVGQITRAVPEDMKGVHTVHTLGGPQEKAILSQEGVLWATLRCHPKNPTRQKRIIAFQRWAVSALDALLSNRPVHAPNGQVLQQPALTAEQIQAAVTAAVEQALLVALPQHVRDGLCGWTEWRAAKLREQAARDDAKRVLAEAVAKLPKTRPTVELIHDEVLAHLRDHGPCSVNVLRAGVRRQKNLLLVVINKLIAEGRVERVMRGSMRCGVRLAAQN